MIIELNSDTVEGVDSVISAEHGVRVSATAIELDQMDMKGIGSNGYEEITETICDATIDAIFWH